MKIFTNKNLIQKVIISIVCITLLNFCMAPKVQASNSWGGDLMGVMRDFVTAIADVGISIVQFGLTGEWNFAVDSKGSGKPDKEDSYFIEAKKFQYPVIQISPELIFADKIEILNIDFISGKSSDNYTIRAGNTEAITNLRTIIASWYVTLRTIAVVGLLSVLIYIGIRIIISSTSQDKAKYKQRLMDWIIAFCLLFFMHYIMAAAVNVIDRVNNVLGHAVHINSGLDLMADYGGVEYTGSNGEEIGSGFQTINWGVNYSGDDDGDAIQTAKDKAAENNATYKSESSDWEQVGGANGIINITYTYKYVIEYEETTVTVWKKSTTNVLSNVTSVSYTYENSADNQAAAGEDYNGTNITKNSKGYVSTDKNKVLYFINYARMYLEVADEDEYLPMSVGFLIIYIILIVFTGMFAVRYMKRVIYIAFLTMIAPVVALTYPLDKLKDRKSASF